MTRGANRSFPCSTVGFPVVVLFLYRRITESCFGSHTEEQSQKQVRGDGVGCEWGIGEAPCPAVAHELGHATCHHATGLPHVVRCPWTPNSARSNVTMCADARCAIPGHAHGISSLRPLRVQDAKEEEQLVWPGGERPHNSPHPAAHLRVRGAPACPPTTMRSSCLPSVQADAMSCPCPC